MKTIKINYLKIENFKGIGELEVWFNETLTTILGENASGKSTILDSFLWVLFGKDSSGASNFKVQPLGKNGETVHKLTTSVEAKLRVDGIDFSFKRELVENWVTPRGTKKEMLNGNTTTYYVNDVPCKESEYSNKVNSICREDDFRLITSTTLFNSMDTATKRKKLCEMSGLNIDDKELAKEFPDVLEALMSGKNIIEFSREVKAKKEKSAALLKFIPARIDENEKSVPKDIDFESLRNLEKEYVSRIETIDSKLQKVSASSQKAYEESQSVRQEIQDIDNDIQELSASFRKQINDKKRDINLSTNKIKIGIDEMNIRLEAKHKSIEVKSSEKTELESKLKILADKWDSVNSERFNAKVNTACPTCKRPFSEAEIINANNLLVETFNKGKVEKLNIISEQGFSMDARIKEIDNEINVDYTDIDGLTKSMDELKEELLKNAKSNIELLPSLDYLLSNSNEYANLLAKKQPLIEKLSSYSQIHQEDDDSLKIEKTNLNNELIKVRNELSKESLITQCQERRKELEEESGKLSQAVADMEKIEWEIHQFQKRKIQIVEDTVASMFSLVRFKMYEQNLTNDGEKEICECCIDGVPYNNLNSAGKVNAGIDICNALSKWLDICAPLWVDNKETVTSLLKTNSQLITLKVEEGKKLTIINQ